MLVNTHCVEMILLLLLVWVWLISAFTIARKEAYRLSLNLSLVKFLSLHFVSSMIKMDPLEARDACSSLDVCL